MEEDHDFSEFEDVELQHRRSLLPWWIWLFIAVFLVLQIFFLGVAVYGGYIFNYSIFGLNNILPYPYAGILSIVLLLLFGFTALSLWLEKKKAINTALAFGSIGLGICLSVMVLSILQGSFYLRIEIVPLADFLFRLTEMRKTWKYGAVSRYDA